MNESTVIINQNKTRNMKLGKVPFKSCYEQNGGNVAQLTLHFRRANANASEKL